MIKWKIITYKNLTKEELYDILALRSEVFVVEQDCVYQDIDRKDQQALHVLGYKNDTLIAYSRSFKPMDYFNEASFGRVIVKEKERKYGYGHDLIKVTLLAIKDMFNETTVKISAQTYLIKFYESHGFSSDGEEYLEDGIPHINMLKTN